MEGVEELALMLGQEVDVEKISAVANETLQGGVIPRGVEELSNAERIILVQYLNLYQGFTVADTQQGQAMLQSVLMNSIGSSSQVMAFEVR